MTLPTHPSLSFQTHVAWSWTTMCCSLAGMDEQPVKQSLSLVGFTCSVGGREMLAICYSKMLKSIALWVGETGLERAWLYFRLHYFWFMPCSIPQTGSQALIVEVLSVKVGTPSKVCSGKVNASVKFGSLDYASTGTVAWESSYWLQIFYNYFLLM